MEDGGLYYLRARYYDPAIGQFLSPDPARKGHPFAYVENDPVNFTDPYGLWKVRIGGKTVFDTKPVEKAGSTANKAIGDATDYLRENGAGLGTKLNEVALSIDLYTAAAVDAATLGYCSAAAVTVIGAPTCGVFYAGAVAAASPFIIASNMISVGASISGCVGTIGNPKEGGASFTNIKNCGVSAIYTTGSLFVVDPNASLVLNTYVVCRDKGECTIP